MTGRRGEEEKGSGGDGGTAREMNGDLANGAASAAVRCRADVSIVKKAGVSVSPVDGTVGGHGSDAAADDGSVTGVAGHGSARAADGLVIVEPTGVATAVPDDDLETPALCDSSWERETEAAALANGRRVWVSGDGASVSAAVTVAAGDLPSVFAANSGYAWSESGSCLT